MKVTTTPSYNIEGLTGEEYDAVIVALAQAKNLNAYEADTDVMARVLFNLVPKGQIK